MEESCHEQCRSIGCVEFISLLKWEQQQFIK